MKALSRAAARRDPVVGERELMGQQGRDRRQRNVALLVAACFFMEMLDGTIVTTAAPRIGASLGVPSHSVSLAITAYVVTLAALIPVSGWMAARWGARRVFLAAIVIFCAASIGCAASVSLTELAVMRVLQGAGGAMMVPVGRAAVLAKTAKTDLMRVTSYLVWPALVAPVLAPLLGGVLTTYASWHWIFLINPPLGVLAFVFALRLIAKPAREDPLPLDRLGVFFTCAGLAGLTYTAQLLSEKVANWTAVAVLGSVSVALTVIAIRHLLRARMPLLNLRTLRVPTFGGSVGGSALFFIVIGAVPFLLPLLFQDVFGWSPVKSGLVVLFVFIGNIAIKPATTYLYGRFGFRNVLVASSVGLACTMVATALLTQQTPVALIGFIALLSGVARSVGGTGYTTVAFTDIPERQMRDASTLQVTVQQLCLGLGVAVAAAALRAGGPIGALFHGGAGPETAYSIAFVLLAVIALLATVSALRLHPSAGEVLRRRPAGRGRARGLAGAGKGTRVGDELAVELAREGIEPPSHAPGAT
jgi:EmrB/QacA subfamily drug resistance transporter